MQVPLLSGVTAGPAAEFIQTHPLNLEPVPVDTKIGKGQLRAAHGAVTIGTGPGGDRGGIVWNGTLYRVMGTRFGSVSSTGVFKELGVVGVGGVCRLDIGFDRLIIQADKSLFYFDGARFTRVTDPDLGPAIDAMWIDGYTMTTDGEHVVVTELSDPTAVHPLKYGSAESDPDPVTGLLRYREEAYVFGRNTVQVMRNVGGNGFPFAPVRGGTIPFGCVGPRAKCLFGDGFAFVGGARDEALNVYVGDNQGQALPFGTRALCDALAKVSVPSRIQLESRAYANEQRLLVHLPTESWCFLAKASKIFDEPIWYRLSSGDLYRIRHAVAWNGRMMVGDASSGAIGVLTDTDAAHFGQQPEWSFAAGMIYNAGRPFTVHSAELVGLPGRGSGPGSVFMSMTRDGEIWAPEKAITIRPGQRSKRLQWRPHKRFTNFMGFRFRGAGASLPSIAALEVEAA